MYLFCVKMQHVFLSMYIIWDKYMQCECVIAFMNAGRVSNNSGSMGHSSVLIYNVLYMIVILFKNASRI